jgi:phage recombination protein Bet
MSTTALVITEVDEVRSQLETVRNVLAPDLTDHELQLFALVAQRSGLDPFAKQIYAVKRQGKVTFQTGIDGYRSTAAKTGEYDGSDEPIYGDIVATPFGHPEWAQVTVYRRRADGSRLAQSATAWWSEFYPGESQGHMWKKMPRNQLAKCAEALALRKAFPYVLADLYTDAEMDQAGTAENPALVAAAAQPTARERIAARRAAVESGVVEGTFRVPESKPLPVTYDQLLTLVEAGNVSADVVAAAVKHQYPDVATARDLSDEERGTIWNAVKPTVAPGQVEAFDPDESARVDAEADA